MAFIIQEVVGQEWLVLSHPSHNLLNDESRGCGYLVEPARSAETK